MSRPTGPRHHPAHSAEAAPFGATSVVSALYRDGVMQLITYADRLAGDLAGLRRLLDGELQGVFDGVHLLPFFVPIDGADAGFDPIDHTAVDPRIGTWDDVTALAADHDVMADLIVNHVSARSAPFVDWLSAGDASPQARMFLTPERVFGHPPTPAEVAAIYRPRPTSPFTSFTFADGTSRLVWTTFTDNQIDIDVEHELGWDHLIGILDRFHRSGITLVRLDAVGYAIKRAGTSCFMLPETFEFIDRLTAACHDRDMQVLVEIHGHHLDQLAIARRVDLVYDFALPPLTLDALYRSDATTLKRWVAMRPTNAVNVLDTHDGIGIIDVGVDPRDPSRPGLLSPEQIHDLVESIHDHSAGTSRAATGAAASNLDLYQVNCTFYDALGRDDERYLAARTIQLLLPGIAQIYYVGLLAGTNDMELLAATGVGRDVNRHRYSPAEIRDALDRPVVRRLVELLRWRSTEPAFDGEFELLDSDDHVLAVRWSSPASTITATVDLRSADVTITG
jgi:sucrose phosphorylase